MADEFDPFKAGAIAVEEEPDFDPFKAGAVPVEEAVSPPSYQPPAPKVEQLSPEEMSRTGRVYSGPDPHEEMPDLMSAPSLVPAEAATAAIEIQPPIQAAQSLTRMLFPDSKAEKVLSGGIEAAGDIAASFTTPMNFGLMAAGGPIVRGLGKLGTVLLSSAFEAQALQHAPEQWKEFKAAYDAGDMQTATRIGLGMVAGLGLPAAAVAIHGAQPPKLSERLAPITKAEPEVAAEAIPPAPVLTEQAVKGEIQPERTVTTDAIQEPSTAKMGTQPIGEEGARIEGRETLGRGEQGQEIAGTQAPIEAVPPEQAAASLILPDDPIIASAFRTPDGKVITSLDPNRANISGTAHMEAADIAAALGIEVNESMAGFVTRSGKFLNRAEALEQAMRQRQLKQDVPANFFPDQLHSGKVSRFGKRAEPEAVPTQPKSPTLLPGEKQGDLISPETAAPETKAATQAATAPKVEISEPPKPAEVAPTEAELSLAPGAASKEEYMLRYSSLGASKLLEGHTELGRFSQEMVREVGTQISEQLPAIFERSKQLINELQTAEGGKASAVQKEINRQVGITKLVEKPERVRLYAALKNVLGAAERAGEAGFKRGVKETKAEGDIALRGLRDKTFTADKWLEADAQAIRRKLIDFSQELPLHERGKFIPAITSALRRAPIFSREPAIMYRRAEAVLNRMTESIYNVRRKETGTAITKLVTKIEKSPSIAVEQKQAIRGLHDQFVNLGDRMSLDMLSRMRDRMLELETHGRDLFQLREVISREKTEAVLREIEGQGVRKVDRPEQLTTALGESPTFSAALAHGLRGIPNFFKHFNLAWTPTDFLFQTFDGKFRGPLYREVKLPIDTANSIYLNARRPYKQRLADIQNKHKLDEGNFERIYAHAELRQEGGLENLKLRYSDAEINSIKTLNRGELEWLREADRINNELFPITQEVLAKFFNQEVPKVDGYFPRQRDWDYYNTLSIEEGRFARSINRSNVEKGFTIERTNAAGYTQTNAFDIMMNHLDDVLYHNIVGPEIARVAKVIKDGKFAEQVGTWGQRTFSDWLDVVSRNGGIESSRRIAVVDVMRTNLGAATLALRFTTTALQPLALIDGMAYVSPAQLSRSITKMASGKNRQWVLENMPEIRETIGDDPAFGEYRGRGLRSKLIRGAFKPITWLDGFARMAVGDAAYAEFRANNPSASHMDAVQYAQQIVRKSQSTSLPKDTPLALSRGNFSGNASVDKSLGQFQNFIIRRWASIKNDGLQMGIREKSPLVGARVMTFLILATVAEQLGREGILQATRYVFGTTPGDKKRDKKESDKSFSRKISERAASDFVTTMPVLSNLKGAFQFESSPIPIIETIEDIIGGTKQAITAKKPETRVSGAIEAGAGAIGISTGLPTQQISDIFRRVIRANAAKRQKETKPKKSAAKKTSEEFKQR